MRAWPILFYLLLPVSVFADCETMLIRAGKLGEERAIAITEEVVETSKDGRIVTYRWRTASATTEEGRREGFIDFVIDSNHPNLIDIGHVYGSPDIPGLGTAFLQELRRRYPHHQFIASLQMLNAQRLLQAVRENPENPDLTKIPSIAALSDDYSLSLNLVRGPDGIVRLIEAELIRVPNLDGKQTWLNNDEFLNHPLYNEWVSQGAQASVIEAWEPGERRRAQ